LPAPPSFEQLEIGTELDVGTLKHRVGVRL
jgi:hypothetical protein